MTPDIQYKFLLSQENRNNYKTSVKMKSMEINWQSICTGFKVTDFLTSILTSNSHENQIVSNKESRPAIMEK